MKNKSHILPNTILFTFGRLFLLLSISFIPFLWGIFLLDFRSYDQTKLIVTVVLLILLTIPLMICEIVMIRLLWHQCFGEIIITNNEIIYFGLFLPTVRLKHDKVKYVDIRIFKEGNVMYPRAKGFDDSCNVDMYKFILISEKPLPRKRVDKIHSSRKNKLVKFAVNKKLCESLVDKLPEIQSRVIDYQLYQYKRTKG